MSCRQYEKLSRDELLVELEAVCRSEARLARIVAVSADAIISVDEQQRIIAYNEGAERMFGWSPAEVMGGPLARLIPERYRAEHRQYVERLARGAEVSRRMGEPAAKIFGLRKSGQEFPADAVISTVEIDGERIITVALRDVSDRHRTELQQRFLAELSSAVSSVRLDFRETKLSIARLITRHLADCCVVDVVAEDGLPRRLAVLHRDPDKAATCRALEQVDVARPSFVGQVLRERRPLVIPEISEALLMQVAQNEEHLQALRAIGAHSAILLPLIAHDKLVGILSMISSDPACPYEPRDLPFYQEIANHSALAVENARLYEAAIEQMRRREQMAAVVTHDLKNPLTTIRMHAQLMLQQGVAPRAAAATKRAADQMLHLIDDLLDAARIETAPLKLARQAIPAASLVQAALAALPVSDAARLETHLPYQGLAVFCDRDRILQALSRLISTALRLTSAGAVALHVERAGYDAQFSVEGIQPALAPAELPYLFDRYHRLQEGGPVGPSLALSVAKAIIDQHGGRIWAESDPASGTSLHFTLPVDDTVGDQPSPPPFG